MIDNWYLSWEYASARQRELLAWARAEQDAASARRAHRDAIRRGAGPGIRLEPQAAGAAGRARCCEGDGLRRPA
jgi:hypothetical protein